MFARRNDTIIFVHKTKKLFGGKYFLLSSNILTVDCSCGNIIYTGCHSKCHERVDTPPMYSDMQSAGWCNQFYAYFYTSLFRVDRWSRDNYNFDANVKAWDLPSISDLNIILMRFGWMCSSHSRLALMSWCGNCEESCAVIADTNTEKSIGICYDIILS